MWYRRVYMVSRLLFCLQINKVKTRGHVTMDRYSAYFRMKLSSFLYELYVTLPSLSMKKTILM